ncbi:MAG TPA: hypothetical protein VMS14_00085 [Ilumatobacteraceae bacterium]|nr:hypothetical protein [Ilumatobacteraceae bacterium]
MARTLRRLLLLALVAAAVVAWYSRRSRPGPLDLTPTTFGVETPDSGASPPKFVAPEGEACPAGYPVKANERSMIFHVPGGRFYERTIPERCYATAEDAEADGYRRAKA